VRLAADIGGTFTDLIYLDEAVPRMILGTDSDNPYLVPGALLHDELGYLVQARFAPAQAVEAGALNAAEIWALPHSHVISNYGRELLGHLQQNPAAGYQSEFTREEPGQYA